MEWIIAKGDFNFMLVSKSNRRKPALLLLALLLILTLAACKKDSSPTSSPSPSGSEAPSDNPSGFVTPAGNSAGGENDPSAVPVDSDANSMTVLVNKTRALPDNYRPDDLVYPDVHFIFADKIEKRMLRQEAATALEKLFAGAKADGIYLGGVSGFRSQETQAKLFQRYVDKDGLEKAKTYSSVPGYSEHQTGLSIDVSDSSGNCAAEFCFEGTPEAEWLAEHAHEYGYIIRYPKGKEDITGFAYEPWHIRYVGTEVAGDIYKRGITLEEYYGVVPVSK